MLCDQWLVQQQHQLRPIPTAPLLITDQRRDVDWRSQKTARSAEWETRSTWLTCSKAMVRRKDLAARHGLSTTPGLPPTKGTSRWFNSASSITTLYRTIEFPIIANFSTRSFTDKQYGEGSLLIISNFSDWLIFRTISSFKYWSVKLTFQTGSNLVLITLIFI